MATRFTWRALKAAVEAAGVQDEDVIDYIDVGHTTALAGVKVRIVESTSKDEPRTIVIT